MIINELKVKKLVTEATIPTRGSVEAAGWDLYAAEDATINPGETIKISTGIAIALPENTFGAIFARSGLATKKGLAPANKVGVVDSDYRGPVIVALYNHSKEERTVNAGDRIAQLVVLPYVPVDLTEVEELDDTERGDGGFGHTGV